MQIDESDEHDENTSVPIRERVEPASNVTLESALQAMKQHRPSLSTDDRMQIDERDEQLENPARRIRESLERASNATFRSVQHPKK
jgi:hypothetical protein